MASVMVMANMKGMVQKMPMSMSRHDVCGYGRMLVVIAIVKALQPICMKEWLVCILEMECGQLLTRCFCFKGKNGIPLSPP